MRAMELRMSWNLAIALGAALPKTVSEHRTMLRSGKFIRIRAKELALVLFWELQPGLNLTSS